MFTLLQVDSFGSIVDKKDNEKKYTELKQPGIFFLKLFFFNSEKLILHFSFGSSFVT